MFFRLRLHFRARLVCSLFALLAMGGGSCGEPPAFEVDYSPEALFRGEPLTFRLRANSPRVLTVTSNAVPIATLEPRPGKPAEITLFPIARTDILFSDSEGSSRSFRVLPPAASQPFQERDGFLESEGQALILMPEHRKPPPLDRRWETADIIKNMLVDTRHPLGPVLWICPPDSTLSTKLQPLLSHKPALHLEAAHDAWFRVHSPLLVKAIPKAAFLVLEIDTHDLDRGIAPPLLFLKWQFTLQHLQTASGFRDGLLCGPPLDPYAEPARELLALQFESLARAHGLRYIDRTLPEDTWRARLLHQLKREYTLP
jgi:hypothetical protein